MGLFQVLPSRLRKDSCILKSYRFLKFLKSHKGNLILSNHENCLLAACCTCCQHGCRMNFWHQMTMSTIIPNLSHWISKIILVLDGYESLEILYDCMYSYIFIVIEKFNTIHSWVGLPLIQKQSWSTNPARSLKFQKNCDFPYKKRNNIYFWILIWVYDYKRNNWSRHRDLEHLETQLSKHRSL